MKLTMRMEGESSEYPEPEVEFYLSAFPPAKSEREIELDALREENKRLKAELARLVRR